MRDVLQVLLVAALVLLLGGVVYRLMFGGPSTPPLLVERVEGEVLHISAGASTNARPGQVLEPSDRVVAREGSRAVLGLGEDTRLVLHASSSVRVLGQGEDGLRVELEDGRVQATVRPGAGLVGVRARDREVRAENASFAMGIGDDNTVMVDVSVGDVALRGFGDQTALVAGQRVIASPGQEPVVNAIPESLLLDVRWPEHVRTKEQQVIVSGRTEPGATVRIKGMAGGEKVIADTNGSFELTVGLAEGDNALELEAVDALGNQRRVSWSITRDSRGPTGEFTVRPF